MGYQSNQNRTFRQKASRFLKKFALVAAFGAAVAGTGVNYYGSDEKIDTKITSVEVTNPGAAGELPHYRIHTENGTFSNETTRMLLKDGDDVRDIAEVLKPGAHVELTVYGLNPHIGKYSRDDLHLYRNIRSVTVFPAEQQAAGTVKPGAATHNAYITRDRENWNAPVTDPALRGDLPHEDREMAESHVVNADLKAVAAHAPQIARDLNTMSQLPLTGYGLYNALMDPSYGIETTLFPVPKGTGSTSTYLNRQIRVARGAGVNTSMHEYFHAWQDLTNPKYSIYNLEMKDAVIGSLLQEANAVAFELASAREAANHGVPYAAAETYTQRVGTSVITFTETSASTNPDNIKAFNDAYDAAWAANEGADASTREAKALSAGGKAVVTRLMQGKDERWKNAYVERTITHINNNIGVFRAQANDPGYAAKRAEVFEGMGRVSDKLNFTPDAFSGTGPGVAQQVDQTFKGLGFSFKRVAEMEQTIEPTQPENAPPKEQAGAKPAKTTQPPVPKAPRVG